MAIPQQLRGTLALTERSLRLDARGWRQHMFRGGLLAVLSFLVWVPGSDRAMYSALGQQIFSIVIYANLICLTFVGGVYFASTIAEEKDEDTLGLLKMAGLSPVAILCGKSVPRLVNALLLMVVQLPFTMLCITLGGVAVEQIVAAYVALAAYTLLLAAVGLFISVVSPGTLRASSAMSTLLAVWLLVVPLTGTLIGAIRVQWGVSDVALFLQAVTSALVVPNPFYRISVICRPSFSGDWWSAQVLWSLITGAGAFAASWAVFERATRHSQRAAAARPWSVRLASLFRRKSKSRPPVSRAWRRAVVWKDFYFLGGGWQQLVWKTIALLAVVAGLEALTLYMVGNPSPSDFRQSLAIVCMAVGLPAVAIEFPVQVTRVFQEEIRWKTLEPLLMLPMSALALIAQKLAAAVLPLMAGLGVLGLGVVALPPGQRWDLVRSLFEEPMFVAGCLSSYVAFVVLAARLGLQLRWGAIPIAFVVVFFVAWPGVTLIAAMVLDNGMTEGSLMLIAAVFFGALTFCLAMDFVRKFGQQTLR